MKTDGMCVLYIMLNGSTFGNLHVVVRQGDVSYTLSGAVYLAEEGIG